MIQLLLIAFCDLGCLVALVCSISSLIEYARRAGQGRSFLKPVFVLSRDGEQLSLLSGLVQVQYLVTSLPMSTSGVLGARDDRFASQANDGGRTPNPEQACTANRSR